MMSTTSGAPASSGPVIGALESSGGAPESNGMGSGARRLPTGEGPVMTSGFGSHANETNATPAAGSEVAAAAPSSGGDQPGARKKGGKKGGSGGPGFLDILVVGRGE